MAATATISVTVAKEHLLSLGERMYSDAIELLRELVANAYDADATEARVELSPSAVIVRDDGSGMSLRGLRQYFEVGSAEKRTASLSPRFGRKRIGQFGIGKFAALAAADRFTVETIHGGVRRSVTFDRDAWRSGTSWELPITSEPAPVDAHGTTVRLDGLRRQFHIPEVERFLRQAIPLRAKKFSVLVNGRRLLPKSIPGRIIPIHQPMLSGTIEGEFVIAANPRDVDEPGIECRVRGALIRRETFGLEASYPALLRRVTGSVEAEFLPVLASRADFVRDSPEFRLFYQVVRHALERVLQGMAIERDKRESTRLRKELNEAVEELRRALKEHPDLLPSGRIVAKRKKARGGVTADTISEPRAVSEMAPTGTTSEASSPAPTAEDSPASSTAPTSSRASGAGSPPTSATRRLRIAKLGVTVAFTHLGEDGPEAVTEENLIYVNEDHPTYRMVRNRHDLLRFHLLRLLTQEIAAMKFRLETVRRAFEAQSVLLRDALAVSPRRRK